MRNPIASIVFSATAACFSGLLWAAPAPVAFDWFEYSGHDAVFAKPPPQGRFQNPILAGFYPDPSICRVGNDFYLVTSTFSYFPGVPVFHSKDLVHWEQIGYALDRASQLELSGLKLSEGIFAPTLRYHDGRFYLITTSVQGINNFYVTATNPAGPWSEPHLLPFINGIDPSFFFDDDGRAYVTHNGPPPGDKPLYEGHRAVWLWEVDLKTNKPVGEGKIIINGGVDLSKQPVWIEAPHILKKDGWYYLTCAEGGTSENHSQVVFRAKALDGDWTAFPGNPILTQRDLPADRPDPITSAGHADFVELPNGNWWSVFLAVRPYQDQFFNTGRETYLLPMRWENEWPIILDHGEGIPWQPPVPNLPKWNATPPPTTGNFAWRDDFDQAPLNQAWNYLRTPRGDWASLDTRGPGQLLLKPQANTLNGRENPSWIGRRVQHSSFDSSTRLLAPDAGVSAGLSVIIREDHHYFLGIQSTDSGYVAFVEKADNGEPKRIASLPLDGVKRGEPVYLSIAENKASISFYVARDKGDRSPIVENQDATILTTTKAWGFIGSYVGLYARLEL